MMKRLPLVLICLLSVEFFSVARSAAPAVPRLARNRDSFFVEDDLVYRRFLWLARDGSYQQINRDGSAAAEVDRGTWEQDPAGTVLLHFTRNGLRFRALLSGPLSIMLGSTQKPADLAAAADVIRRWLGQTSDAVFAAASVGELALAPVVLTIDPQAESFRRAALESIVRQIDDFVESELQQTYRLSPHRPGGALLLLIQQGAVFQAADLPRVQAEYQVPSGRKPPFYFAQVNAETFAREAGSWQNLR